MSVEDLWKYLSENEKQIKYELKKNITYDQKLFDDVYNDTIIKVYDAVKRGKDIEDIRMYFFISFKFNYIQAQNKARRLRDKESQIDPVILDITDNEYTEAYAEKVNDFFNYIREELDKHFEPFEVDLFVIYHKLKCGANKISYRKLSQITSVSMGVIVNTIQKLRKFVKESEKINEMKKRLNDD